MTEGGGEGRGGAGHLLQAPISIMIFDTNCIGEFTFCIFILTTSVGIVVSSAWANPVMTLKKSW